MRIVYSREYLDFSDGHARVVVDFLSVMLARFFVDAIKAGQCDAECRKYYILKHG